MKLLNHGNNNPESLKGRRILIILSIGICNPKINSVPLENISTILLYFNLFEKLISKTVPNKALHRNSIILFP